MMEATVLPIEVSDNVERIAEAALQAAFKEIADEMEKLGYPVTGDIAPDEARSLDSAFQGYVLGMALNNGRISEMQDEDPARHGSGRYLVHEVADAGETPVEGFPLGIEAASGRDALAEYAVGQGFADPREDPDGEWFYVLPDGRQGMVFANTELAARKVS